jgi:hypothetical protein
MKVIEPGHIYELNQLDGDGKPLRLQFVNRDGTGGATHEGTQTQEVLRVNIDMVSCLIDRTNHCDACMPWPGNERIIKALSEACRQMNLAILFHEQRVLERKMAKGHLDPAKVPIEADGHWGTRGVSEDDDEYRGSLLVPSCNRMARAHMCPFECVDRSESARLALRGRR